MNPILQVVIGELLGILLMTFILRFVLNADSISTMLVIIFGTIVLTGVIAIFYFGNRDLYFSTSAFKNILIICMYQEIICLVVASLVLLYFAYATADFLSNDFSVVYIVTLILVSFLFGNKLFYPSVCRAFL